MHPQRLAGVIRDAQHGDVGQADEQSTHARSVGFHRGSGGSDGVTTADSSGPCAAPDGPLPRPHTPLRSEAPVKGSWHDQVGTALKDQLADQYMADLGPYGVYVVMFPDTDNWAGTGSRRAAAARRHRTKLMSRLASDAAKLSGRGLAVRTIGGVDVPYAAPGPRT